MDGQLACRMCQLGCLPPPGLVAETLIQDLFTARGFEDRYAVFVSHFKFVHLALRPHDLLFDRLLPVTFVPDKAPPQ